MEKVPVSMGLSRARRLVREYQQVLKDISALLTLGAPETLLPASKDKIRQAIQLVAGATVSVGLDGTTAINSLRTAYMSLANFLNYEEALAASRLQTAFDRGEHSYIASRAAAHSVARAQRIELEAGELAHEFDAFQQQNESGSLLSEIDALLADLDRKFIEPTSG